MAKDPIEKSINDIPDDQLPPPLPLPAAPPGFSSQKVEVPVSGMPFPAGEAGAVGGGGDPQPAAGRSDSGGGKEEILLALNGIQSSLDRLESFLREVMS